MLFNDPCPTKIYLAKFFCFLISTCIQIHTYEHFRAISNLCVFATCEDKFLLVSLLLYVIPVYLVYCKFLQNSCDCHASSVDPEQRACA